MPTFSHVFVIVGENTSLSQLTAKNAPYQLGTIKPNSAWLTDYWGISHYSTSNYIAMTSGQFAAVPPAATRSRRPATRTSRTSSGSSRTPASAGLAWNESMPEPVLLVNAGANRVPATSTAVKHNPAAYYEDVVGDGLLAPQGRRRSLPPDDVVPMGTHRPERQEPGGDRRGDRTVLRRFDGGALFEPSPDGARVAYRLDAPDGTGSGCLRAGPAVGGPATRVTRADTLAFFWSPAGDANCVLLTGDPNGGPFRWRVWQGHERFVGDAFVRAPRSLRRLPSVLRPVRADDTPWAPDGSAFAYAGQHEDASGIWVQPRAATPASDRRRRVRHVDADAGVAASAAERAQALVERLERRRGMCSSPNTSGGRTLRTLSCGPVVPTSTRALAHRRC